MPCYSPLQGYTSRTVNPETGKRSVTFKAQEGYLDLPVSVACGRCVGCRLERSRQWALRCVHEAQLHATNCFITLTYNDEHLPYGGTLIKKHFQDFIKRLRKANETKRISYFHCGEYGENSRRPHYHALLFGHWFADQLPYKKNAAGQTVFTSATLQRLWPMGFCTVGALTFESAAYCARYVMKKVTGDAAAEHYTVIEPETGEIIHLQPEYITMSLKPAIGKEWFEQFSNDVYPDDFVVMRGKKMKPPRYYDRCLKISNPIGLEKIKEGRKAYAATQKANSSPARLAVRQEVKIAQISQLKREL